MNIRPVQQIIHSQASADGDGVKIQRVAGRAINHWLDPFLLLDEIRSDEAADYIGGFPPHPHRGFETITYVLAGRIRHRDHMGNEGVIAPGEAQWLTAGAGVIHSEMPEQEEGLLHGFQLWLNLPQRQKMTPATYRDISNTDIPEVETEHSAVIRVLGGDLVVAGRQFSGPIHTDTTQPLLLDVTQPAHTRLSLPVPATHTVLVYMFAGAVGIPHRAMGIFGKGDTLNLGSAQDDARYLVLAGKPLKEPIAQYGPFVMNTQEEVQQAIHDYQSGQLVSENRLSH